MAACEVSPGASRTESLALTVGIRVLLASAVRVASKPIVAIAGLVHSRSTTEPEPISSTPSVMPDSARIRSIG